MSRLLDIATAELGTTEVTGSQHNPRILNYAHEAGFNWVKTDEVPWCSIFLNWVAHKAGFERTKDGRSRSWATIGTKVNDPQPGDVVLIGTNGDPQKIYHVGLFTGFTNDGKQLFLLGGNQTNSVSISKYWRKNVAGYRRLEALEIALGETEVHPPTEAESPSSTEEKPVQPLPSSKPAPKDPPVTPDFDEAEGILSVTHALLTYRRLQYGSRGDKVKKLQLMLQRLGYTPGTADGIFGRKTEDALRNFQREEGLIGNGIFTRRTRRRMRRKLRKH